VAFFKPSSPQASSKLIARLHAAIWVLIYAGLLTLVLGLAVAGIDHGIGWSLIGVGTTLAVVGAVLIYLRSRIEPHP
jgi:predicted membrane channel-forming protein YqfA (hemolysin III family)